VCDFTEALRLDPHLGEARHNRGLAFAALRDFERAIQDFTAILKDNPHDSAAYNFRGMAYGNQRNYERALADFTEATRLNPEDALAWKNRERTVALLARSRRPPLASTHLAHLSQALVDAWESVADVDLPHSA